MAGENPERQYLIARELDLLLAECEATQSRIDEMVDEMDSDWDDLEPEEVQQERAWLDHLMQRRNELTEELFELQGIRTSAEVVQLDDRRNK